MKKVLPFAGWKNASVGSVSITPIPGYKIRLRGVALSLLPAATVSGPATLAITGLVSNFEFGFGDGQISTHITPSTTDAVNFSLDFGALGVETINPLSPVEIDFTPFESDTLDGMINAWGEYVEL